MPTVATVTVATFYDITADSPWPCEIAEASERLGEYGGSICAVAALRPVANITAATC